MNIKKSNLVVHDGKRFPVMNRNQMNPVTNESVKFALKSQTAECVNRRGQLIVAVNVQIAVVGAI